MYGQRGKEGIQRGWTRLIRTTTRETRGKREIGTTTDWGPCQTAIERTIQRLKQGMENNDRGRDQVKWAQHILHETNVLHHAVNFQQHLAMKTKHTPSFYNALFRDGSSILPRQHISFDEVSVLSLNNEVLSESVIKRVTFNEQLSFHAEWRIESNRIHNLGVNTWSCSMRIGELTQSTDDMLLIVDRHDCSSNSDSCVNADVLGQSKLGSPFNELSKGDFAWLLTDVLTFPSDHAFDVLSKSLISPR